MENINKKHTGFTLLELMIAVLVVSVIAMFSFPGYKNQTIKLRRIEARIALYNLANKLEEYYLVANTYARATIATGSTTDVLSSSLSANKNYILSILHANKSAFKIQAAAVDNTDEDCMNLTLTNSNQQDANGVNTHSCW